MQNKLIKLGLCAAIGLSGCLVNRETETSTKILNIGTIDIAIDVFGATAEEKVLNTHIIQYRGEDLLVLLKEINPVIPNRRGQLPPAQQYLLVGGYLKVKRSDKEFEVLPITQESLKDEISEVLERKFGVSYGISFYY